VVGLVNLRLPYNNRLFLTCEACAFSWPPSSWALNIPCPLIHQISLDLVIPITFLFYHVLPYINLHPISHANHEPPINSLYQPLALHVSVGPQPYTFQNPLDLAQLEPFPFSILLALIVALD